MGNRIKFMATFHDGRLAPFLDRFSRRVLIFNSLWGGSNKKELCNPRFFLFFVIDEPLEANYPPILMTPQLPLPGGDDPHLFLGKSLKLEQF